MLRFNGRSYTCYKEISHCAWSYIYDVFTWFYILHIPYSGYLVFLLIYFRFYFIIFIRQKTYMMLVCRAIRLDAGQGGSRWPPFSMSALRTLLFIALLLLILTAGYCKQRDRDDTSLLDLLRVRLTREHRSDGNLHSPKIAEESIETKEVYKVTKTDENERILGKDHFFDWFTHSLLRLDRY